MICGCQVMTDSNLLSLERAASRVMEDLDTKVLGTRLRRERLGQGLSIRDLARNANVGANSVVRLESGAECRPITLTKLCAALGIHVDRLLTSGQNSVAIHKKSDDHWHGLDDYGSGSLALSEKSDKGNAVNLLKSRLETGKILPTLIEIIEPSPERSHPGEEFVYVIRGVAVIVVSGQEHVLQEGESLEFWGDEPHSYRPASSSPCLLLSLRINPRGSSI